MFIIFGFRDTNKKIAERNEWCYACKNTKALYIRTISWFTLFFIPIFPILFKYSKVCTVCRYTMCMKKKQFFEELSKSDVLPPPPFSQNSNEENKEIVMREITIIREKRFYGSMVKINCFIDSNKVAEVKNGKTVKFAIDNRERNLFAMMDNLRSNIIILEPDSDNRTYQIRLKGQTIQLSRI